MFVKYNCFYLYLDKQYLSNKQKQCFFTCGLTIPMYVPRHTWHTHSQGSLFNRQHLLKGLVKITSTIGRFLPVRQKYLSPLVSAITAETLKMVMFFVFIYLFYIRINSPNYNTLLTPNGYKHHQVIRLMMHHFPLSPQKQTCLISPCKH